MKSFPPHMEQFLSDTTIIRRSNRRHDIFFSHQLSATPMRQIIFQTRLRNKKDSVYRLIHVFPEWLSVMWIPLMIQVISVYSGNHFSARIRFPVHKKCQTAGIKPIGINQRTTNGNLIFFCIFAQLICHAVVCNRIIQTAKNIFPGLYNPLNFSSPTPRREKLHNRFQLFPDSESPHTMIDRNPLICYHFLLC